MTLEQRIAQAKNLLKYENELREAIKALSQVAHAILESFDDKTHYSNEWSAAASAEKKLREDVYHASISKEPK